MEKKEIIGLIAAVAAVFMMIFIVSVIRGQTDDPNAETSDEPPVTQNSDEPVQTDIWDVLHEMQATTAPAGEPLTVAVTAVNEEGIAYTVTDENGGAVTEIVQNPEAMDGASRLEQIPAVTDAPVPADAPVIQVSPDMSRPDQDENDTPYFITAPAD